MLFRDFIMNKFGSALAIALSFALIGALIAPPAHAGTAVALTDQGAADPTRGDEPDLTVTIAPALLLLMTLYVSVEFPVREKWSMAVQGALGAPSILGQTIIIAAAGAQLRRRLIGSFRSNAYVGGTALLSRGTTPDSKAAMILAGPMLGYKQSLGAFTLDLHGGVGLQGASEPMYENGPDGAAFAVVNDHLAVAGFLNITLGSTF